MTDTNSEEQTQEQLTELPKSIGGFIPLDSPLPRTIAAKTNYVIEFTGSGDMATCLNYATSLFYLSPCFVHSCSFNGVYQPRLEDSKFVALGQFNKIQKTFNLSAQATPNDFLHVAQQICGKSYRTLVEEKRKGVYGSLGKRGVMKLCWKLLWIAGVLHWGYGFPRDSTAIHYTSNILKNNVHNSSIPAGWAIGSAIYEVNRLPWTIYSRVDHAMTITTTVVFLSLFIYTYLLWKQVYSYQRVFNLANIFPDHTDQLNAPLVASGYRSLS